MTKNSRKSAGPVMDIGISEDDRAAIAAGLSRLLADSATLYLMTHNFHWNVKRATTGAPPKPSPPSWALAVYR